jgi:hypothetical protein
VAASPALPATVVTTPAARAATARAACARLLPVPVVRSVSAPGAVVVSMVASFAGSLLVALHDAASNLNVPDLAYRTR